MTKSSQNVIEPIKPELAVVVPVHNEAEKLRPLIDEIRTALSNISGESELIYVDAPPPRVSVPPCGFVPGVRPRINNLPQGVRPTLVGPSLEFVPKASTMCHM